MQPKSIHHFSLSKQQSASIELSTLLLWFDKHEASLLWVQKYKRPGIKKGLQKHYEWRHDYRSIHLYVTGWNLTTWWEWTTSDLLHSLVAVKWESMEFQPVPDRDCSYTWLKRSWMRHLTFWHWSDIPWHCESHNASCRHHLFNQHSFYSSPPEKQCELSFRSYFRTPTASVILRNTQPLLEAPFKLIGLVDRW